MRGKTADETKRVGDGHGTCIYLMGPGGAFLTPPPIMDAETMAATIRRYLI